MDESTAVGHTLGSLAGRIAEEHRQCQQAATVAVMHAMAAGDLLIEAKALCGHGEWAGWVAEHCAVAERTAQLYMRLARNRPLVEANAQRVAGLGIRQAAALLTTPRLDATSVAELAHLEGVIERGLPQLDALFGSREAAGIALMAYVDAHPARRPA